MPETFNPPDTIEGMHEALEACLSKAISPANFGTSASLVWLERYGQLYRHAMGIWPDDFPELDENGDPVKPPSGRKADEP
jgi:hypothetical protein